MFPLAWRLRTNTKEVAVLVSAIRQTWMSNKVKSVHVQLQSVINLSVKQLSTFAISGDVMIPSLSLMHFRLALMPTLFGNFVDITDAVLHHTAPA
jgi:hypothetical protein